MSVLQGQYRRLQAERDSCKSRYENAKEASEKLQEENGFLKAQIIDKALYMNIDEWPDKVKAWVFVKLLPGAHFRTIGKDPHSKIHLSEFCGRTMTCASMYEHAGKVVPGFGPSKGVPGARQFCNHCRNKLLREKFDTDTEYILGQKLEADDFMPAME